MHLPTSLSIVINFYSNTVSSLECLFNIPRAALLYVWAVSTIHSWKMYYAVVNTDPT